VSFEVHFVDGSLDTSFVVPSLSRAVAVSWLVSPTLVNERLPLIVTPVTVTGTGAGAGGSLGAVGDTGTGRPVGIGESLLHPAHRRAITTARASGYSRGILCTPGLHQLVLFCNNVSARRFEQKIRHNNGTHKFRAS
jgi:hypothetical protein